MSTNTFRWKESRHFVQGPAKYTGVDIRTREGGGGRDLADVEDTGI